MRDRRITFYHSPQSRSFGVRVLLEELGADYELQHIDLKRAEQRSETYLTVNPMGKVPAILHGDILVTEQAAVCLYLAELYPEAGLSPAPHDPLRGPYLRWMVFYGSCLEPAIFDRSLQRDAGDTSTCPYGDFDSVVAAVGQRLSEGPFLLGERFTGADVLWGIALGWMSAFKLLPDLPQIRSYVARIESRPAVARARAMDLQLTS